MNKIEMIASLYEGRTFSLFNGLLDLDDYDKQQIKEIISHGGDTLEDIYSIVDELVEYVEGEGLI